MAETHEGEAWLRGMDSRHCQRDRSGRMAEDYGERGSANFNMSIHSSKDVHCKLERDSFLCKCGFWLATTMSMVPIRSADIIHRLQLEKVLCPAGLAT